MSSLALFSSYFKQWLLQAQHKQSNQLAAAKMCALEGEDDLSDFMIEIDILSECKHPNIVELHEAYFMEGKLWVRFIFVLYLQVYSITIIYESFPFINESFPFFYK